MKTVAAFAFVALALAACNNGGAKPDNAPASSATAASTASGAKPAASAAPKAGSGW